MALIPPRIQQTHMICRMRVHDGSIDDLGTNRVTVHALAQPQLAGMSEFQFDVVGETKPFAHKSEKPQLGDVGSAVCRGNIRRGR
ncbi:MAG: hypothetical protein QOG73_2443 [Acetobacteraceae bacterium]|nr:hypothetical protein [Acetobacteraceae bacterium]